MYHEPKLKLLTVNTNFYFFSWNIGYPGIREKLVETSKKERIKKELLQRILEPMAGLEFSYLKYMPGLGSS